MSNSSDPYTYPESSVLINKLGLRSTQALDIAESHFFLVQLSKEIPDGSLDYTHLKAIHYHLFKDIYDWAGEERSIGISKGESTFAHPKLITPYLNKLFIQLAKEDHLANTNLPYFCEKISYYFSEINAVHPFREGNGRTQRLFIDKLAAKAGFYISWKDVNQDQYIQASVDSFNGNNELLHDVFSKITRPLKLSSYV